MRALCLIAAAAAAIASCTLLYSSVQAADLRTPALDAEIYNGLLIPEMATIAGAMTKRGQRVEVLWHEAEAAQTACPPYLLGHSMGGNAALRQAARCAAAGHPPRVVVTIDPGRAPLYHACPRGVRCLNYYDPSHPIGGQSVAGAANIRVPGYSHLQLPSVPSVVRGALAATSN
jgi:hypothetical protein